MSKKLSNITPDTFRRFLKKVNCSYCYINGGHEYWNRERLSRKVVFQTHCCPIPERVIQNNLRTLGITKKEFIKLLGEI